MPVGDVVNVGVGAAFIVIKPDVLLVVLQPVPVDATQ